MYSTSDFTPPHPFTVQLVPASTEGFLKPEAETQIVGTQGSGSCGIFLEMGMRLLRQKPFTLVRLNVP